MKTLEHIKCTYSGQVQQFDKEMTFESFTYKIENGSGDIEQGTAVLSEVATDTVGYLRDNETGHLFRIDLEEPNTELTFKFKQRFIHICAEKQFYSISTNHKLTAGTAVYHRGALETVAIDVVGSIVRFESGGSASVHDCYQLIEEPVDVTPDYEALVAEHQQDNMERHSEQISWGLDCEVRYEARDLPVEWVKYNSTIDPDQFVGVYGNAEVLTAFPKKFETLLQISQICRSSGMMSQTIRVTRDDALNIIVILRGVNRITLEESLTHMSFNFGQCTDERDALITQVKVQQALDLLTIGTGGNL